MAALAACFAAMIAGCTSESPPVQKTEITYPPPVACASPDSRELASAESRDGLSAELQSIYQRSCQLCHENAGAGAPQRGNQEQWNPRVAKGRDILLDHTINGFGSMPPLGLCMDCSESELAALIEFLSGGME